ncbi:MAG: type 3 dihydrofolate reductase [Mariprofundaceae bacterium]|nr:type 3 dihydrofolate reductase [Mariprofundaceae bacterium]
MIISLIWAQDENGIIGKEGKLPWQLPADMAWFREHTLGKPVLMGRKTYESIGKPLPERTNIVLTGQDLDIEDCVVVHSPEEAIEAAGDAGEMMVIGGAEIYALFLPRAERLYITEIQHAFDGDTSFPVFNRDEWREIHHEEHTPDDKNAYNYRFVILARR